MNGKQILVGIAVVALIAVAYIAFDNSESNDYAVGTIGAADTVIAGVESANRYRSEQMSDADVVLGDTELQRLLQSEIIQELINNPTFARAIQDPDVRTAMEEGWTDAIFETDETRESLAAIPIDDAGYEVPTEDIARDMPIDDNGGDPSYKEVFDDEFVQAALRDDRVRGALLDDYVRELMGEDWFKAALDDQEVQRWLKDLADTSEELEEFKSDEDREEFKADEDREEFKTDLDREEFKADQDREEFKAAMEDVEEFKATTEEVEQFKAALEGSPELKKAVFEHAEVFHKAATEPGFQKALQEGSAGFAKMESLLGKAVMENGTLARAIAEDPETFQKAVQLAKIPELQKMDEGMRKAVLTNKSVQEVVFARATEFEKTGGLE